MNKILAEQKFQQLGYTDQDYAVKLGKLLNVHRVIVGTVSKLMKAYYINVSVVNVETGEIEFSEQDQVSTPNDWTKACSQISDKIELFYKSRKL
jgi:PBP1b-binding outer membrane lipoprotein LpoB